MPKSQKRWNAIGLSLESPEVEKRESTGDTEIHASPIDYIIKAWDL